MNPDAVAVLLLTFAGIGFVAGWRACALIAQLDVLDARIQAERDRRRAMFGEDGA